jgi:hypothetical protein
VADDIVVRREDAVRQPVAAQVCQMFSTGLSLRLRGGRGSSVMLSGTASLAEVCQPAWSSMRMVWAPGSTARLISSRCAAMDFVVHQGRTRPAPFPLAGQIAPKM